MKFQCGLCANIIFKFLYKMTRTHSEKTLCRAYLEALLYKKMFVYEDCLAFSLLKHFGNVVLVHLVLILATATTTRNINNIMQFLFCQTIIVVHGYIMKYWSLQIIAISFKVLKFISFFVVSKRYMLLIQFQQILCSRKFNNILFCCCFGLVFLIIF